MTTRITKDHAHLDIGMLSAPEKTAEGFLRADAYVTRSGIFNYRNPDGSKRREYRPAEEVFKQDSLNTLRSLPVTDEHPPQMLDAGNASEYQRGSLGDTPRRDGALVAIGVMVTDAALIEKMETKKSLQTSCGYRCDLEWTEGVSPSGERYDAIQRNIRYNHLAVLPKGRAGSDVSVRMDAAELDVVLDPIPAAPSERQLKTIRIDGIDFPVDSDAAVQALARMDNNHREMVQAKDKAISELQAKFDAADKARAAAVIELDQAKKDAAELPGKVRKELEVRTALETKARKVLGDKVSLDGLDEKAVQLKVLAKLAPKTKFDGKSDEQIDARFDSEIERFDADDKSEEREDLDDAGEEDRNDEDVSDVRLDSEAERKKLLKASGEMWKKPIGASVSASGRGLQVVRE